MRRYATASSVSRWLMPLSAPRGSTHRRLPARRPSVRNPLEHEVRFPRLAPNLSGVGGIHMGPLAEAQLRNAVSIGEGSFTVFLQRPMSLGLLVLVVAILVLPRLARARAARRLRAVG